MNKSIRNTINRKTDLTQNQYLMWLGQKINPDIPLYNMVLTFTISGEINPATFQQAFQVLVDQTDAMRLVIDESESLEEEIESENKLPQQTIISSMEYEVELLDFSEKFDPKKELGSWQEERAIRSFDLSEYLFDSVLIKVGTNQYVWYLNQHHLITDGWSSTVVYKRMSELYEQVRQGDVVANQYPRYEDYIDYEKSVKESTSLENIKSYWHEKLSQKLKPTQFFGTEADENKTTKTKRVSYTFNQQQIDGLSELIQRTDVRAINEDLTKFSIFAAILFMLMYRLSGIVNKQQSKKIRIGTPYHNRPTEAFKNTVGLFIEVGVLQVEINPEETFLSLVKQVQAEVLTGLRYAQPGSSSAETNGAYDVLINYIHADYGDFAGMPMQSEWVHPGYGDRHHNLRLQVHDHDQTGGFTLHFDMNNDVFTPQQSQWFIQHFNQSLATLASDPTQPIHSAKLLSRQQWQTRIIDFNDTSTSYSKNKKSGESSQTVVDLFEAQVKQTPDAIALVLDKQEITYQELNNRANQLAHYLQSSKITGLVGLLVERSIEAIVGIWGILKSGNAYVPIDSTTPPERIAYILADAQVSLLLTQQNLNHLMGDSELKCEVLCLDSDWHKIKALPLESPDVAVSQDDLAYVIYTSGSTGQPKGVMIRHQGLIHYIQWAKKFYLQGQALDFPLYSSLAFDLTITSLFTPLVSGGRLVIYPEESVSDSGIQGLEILTVIEDNAVDIIKMTPAHLSLLKELNIESSRIKKIIVGGEDFKTELAEKIHHHFKDSNNGANGIRVLLFNEYGPTETVVGCMIHQYDPNLDHLTSVPIGKPIDNTQIYILDENLNPVPTGVIGELYIAGNGVGRGYINQPELTKQYFMTNPFSIHSKSDSKIYRSGDQARWIGWGENGENDQIELLGRADNQVKIKGYRIELDEIETVLLKHPAISAAVVDVTEQQYTKWPSQLDHCTTCGLPSNYPEATFDEQGVCNTCRDFEAHQGQVESYFRTREDLQVLLNKAKETKTGKYDCLVLLSGGKDSTYMLCQIVEAGATPLVFSLDNGYISESAKENVKRITEGLGLDHLWGSTPEMNTIFRDSLQRFSNVCQGCFKTIYTLSYNLAKEQGINTIVTGLSRGQLFETRLSDTFNAGLFDATEIDKIVVDARKIYHRLDDAVSQCMDTRIFETDDVFEDIQFVDFYRYTDVEFEEMYDYLIHKTPWERPKDTGRSTNCLINDMGIYVHKKEQGYHNYALPYSWDVRIGHKVRAEALHELDDEMDMTKVGQMLKEIGYDDPATLQAEKKLAAYYVSKQPLNTADLKAYLVKVLPEYMVPNQFFVLDEIPLTSSGKVDRRELAKVSSHQSASMTAYVEPKTPKALLLADIWASVLPLGSNEKIGLHDNFFDLGGDSISGIQIVAKAKQAGLLLKPKHIFEHQTIAELSKVVKTQQTKPTAVQNETENKINKSKTTTKAFPLANLDKESLGDLEDVLNQLGGS